MSKDPNSNHWWPPQKMPAEYWVTAAGSFTYVHAPGGSRGLDIEGVLKMADDAELLAKELREAAALMKQIQESKKVKK